MIETEPAKEKELLEEFPFDEPDPLEFEPPLSVLPVFPFRMSSKLNPCCINSICLKTVGWAPEGNFFVFESAFGDELSSLESSFVTKTPVTAKTTASPSFCAFALRLLAVIIGTF